MLPIIVGSMAGITVGFVISEIFGKEAADFNHAKIEIESYTDYTDLTSYRLVEIFDDKDKELLLSEYLQICKGLEISASEFLSDFEEK